MFPLVLPFVWLPETTTNRLKEKEGAAYMKANTIVVQSILNDQLEVEEEYNQHVDDALRIGTQKAVLSTSYGGFYYTIMLAFMTAGAWFGMNSIWEDRSVRATGDLFTVFWLLFVGAVRVGQSVPQLGAIWAAVTTGQKVLKELDPTLSLNDAIVPTATMSTIDENLFDQKSLDVDTQPIIGVANNTFDSDHLRVISVTNRHLQFLESQSSPKPNAVVRSSLLKMILKLCGREVAILTTAIVAMIVRSCIWPLYTWLLGQFNEMLNDPTPMANKNTAILFATTLVIVSLLGGLLNFSGSAAMAVLGERIGRRCRAAALKSRTSNESKASSIKNLLSVPVQIQIAIDTRFSDILEATLALMLILYTAAYYNWQIALVELGVVVLYEFCQLQVFSNLFPKVQKLFELEEKTLNLLIESSTSAMTTPLRITREKYNELADQTHKSLVRIGLCEAFSFAMGMSYEGLNFALIYLLGTCFYADLGFSPFSYFQVAQMVNGGFLISIIPTASYAPELVRALVAASRLSALTTRDNHQL
ncbi:hypothetical protein M3Y94_01088000 [Aphelenchoides besseyi]|nr:hypothetical protein M3Y94_01088000 [Aphelenchoides besseyi]